MLSLRLDDAISAAGHRDRPHSQRRPMLRSFVPALLIAAAAGSAALAQPRAPDIAGAWRFETAPYDGGACRMDGEMTITRTPRTGEYECAFVATEVCGQQRWSAQQTCTAKREGDRLVVSSRIVRTTPENLSYQPDNWALVIRSGELMVGELRSADIAEVQFRRGPALVS
jgi:hypothetical protein